MPVGLCSLEGGIESPVGPVEKSGVCLDLDSARPEPDDTVVGRVLVPSEGDDGLEPAETVVTRESTALLDPVGGRDSF